MNEKWEQQSNVTSSLHPFAGVWRILDTYRLTALVSPVLMPLQVQTHIPGLEGCAVDARSPNIYYARLAFPSTTYLQAQTAMGMFQGATKEGHKI